MCKVSVIIPAYNVEEYIAKTLSSVIAQTLKDIEIVVVDDCSTDSTLEIISKYAELDKRIKIVKHEENVSVSRARLSGLKVACGEYVMLVDGDDMLTPDACEKAYEAITSENVDILQFDLEVSFSAPSKDNGELERSLRADMYSSESKLVSPSKAGLLDKEAAGDIVNFTLWDKIYKRELIEKAAAYVPDEYLNMAEDVLFSFLIQYHAHSYSFISDKLYIYRFGCGISTTSALSERRMLSYSKTAYVYEFLSKWVKSNDSEKECKSALYRVHKQTYRCIAGVYIHHVPKSKKEFFISETLKYANTDNLILGLSELLYDNEIAKERIPRECCSLDMFSAKKKEAKTIGVYYFRVYNGGVENVISSLTDIWVKSGYNVVIFTDEPPHKDDYYINPAIKRVIVPKLVKRDYFNRKERIEVFRKALIENNIDVMVNNAWVSPDLVLDEMIIKSCGINLIIHAHSLFCCDIDSPDGECAYFFSILPKLYAFADSVISLNEVDDAWWNTAGIRSFRTRNPIKFNTDITPASLNGNNIIFVGRISEEKNVIDALKIVELVRKEIPDVKLTVVGKGDIQSYIDRVNDYIETNKLSDCVDMVGFTSNVLPYYQAANVMIATSRFEGSPLCWLESKMCGLPLVCYSLPHLDILRDGRGSIVVEQSDVVEAARAVIKILKDEKLKKELGRAARESAEDFFRMDLAEHWKSIFEKTLIPKEKPKSIYELPVAEAAVRIAVDKYSAGIFKRANMSVNSPSNAALIKALNDVNEEAIRRGDELERIRNSECYRIGLVITFIPRKIKALLRKIFRRNPK